MGVFFYEPQKFENFILRLDFLLSHGGEIARIAIVAEPRWEVQALAFAGAGVRRAPVKFFTPDQLAEARAWLAE